MARIYVIGCGRVGSAMARDLALNHNVFAADLDLTSVLLFKEWHLEISGPAKL